jgi:hypothetical protein
MENNIDNIVRKTYRYYYDDGLVEMAIGLLFIAVGLILLAWQSSDFSPLVTIVVVMGLLVVAIGGVYLLKRLASEMKRRITYPRTGYVAYRQGEPSIGGRWLFLLAALALGGVSLFLPDSFTGMSAVVGAILGAVLILMGYRVSLPRFYIVGIIALVSGVALSWSDAAEFIAVALTFTIAGGALFLAGGFALISYLRDHPRPNGEMS